MAEVRVTGRLTHKMGGTWSPFHSNLVVDSGGAVLAAGMAALDGKVHAPYHALGVGRFQWDVDLPNPSRTESALVDEFFRKQPDSITYITETEGLHNTQSPNPDNQLEAAELGALGASALAGRLVEIIAGTSAGDVREIVAVSGDVVTLDSDLSSTPDATTRWRVGTVSATETNTVDIETTFLAAEDNSDGQIREQALFMGSATAELGTGTMLSIVRHAVLTKSGSDLVQIWRIKVEIV